MPNDKQPIFVYGASGHAKVIIGIIEKSNEFVVQFLVDDNRLLKGTIYFGYPVIGGKNELLALENKITHAIVAIGRNEARCAVAHWLKQNGYQLAIAIHPSAQIGREVEIGEGTVVMANTVISPAAIIGENVVINTKASVGHDNIIEDGVHVGPAVTICGTVTVGEKTFIGAGSTVINNISIGKNVLIGAGTTIYKNVKDGMKVVGPRLPL